MRKKIYNIDILIIKKNFFQLFWALCNFSNRLLVSLVHLHKYFKLFNKLILINDLFVPWQYFIKYSTDLWAKPFEAIHQFPNCFENDSNWTELYKSLFGEITNKWKENGNVMESWCTSTTEVIHVHNQFSAIVYNIYL